MFIMKVNEWKFINVTKRVCEKSCSCNQFWCSNFVFLHIFILDPNFAIFCKILQDFARFCKILHFFGFSFKISLSLIYKHNLLKKINDTYFNITLSAPLKLSYYVLSFFLRFCRKKKTIQNLFLVWKCKKKVVKKNIHIFVKWLT